MTAVGLLSGFTGKGADILIIDDPYASPDEARSHAVNERVWRWWNELAKVRINDQTNVIVMFHRYHEDDFAGRLLAEGYREAPSLAAPAGGEGGRGARFRELPIDSQPSVMTPTGDAEPVNAEPEGGAPEPEAKPGTQNPRAKPGNPSAKQENPGAKREKPALWRYFRFPAIADENEDGDDPTGRQPGELLSPIRSLEFLEEIKDREPLVWLGQFQGRPRAPEGAFIKREWLREVSATELPNIDQWVRFWDLATRAKEHSDFFSGALVGIGPGQVIYIRDIVRFRRDWPDARDIIASTTVQDQSLFEEMGAEYQVGVEDVPWQQPMIQDLFTLAPFKSVRLTSVRPKGDKKQRASGWVARSKNDQLRLARGHWNADFIAECLAFDGLGSTHDDQIDSVSGAYDLIWDLRGGLVQYKKEPEVGSFQWWKDRARQERIDNGIYKPSDYGIYETDDEDDYTEYYYL